MKSFKLSRRTVLRGAAGAAVGLPMLEAMIGSRDALAATGSLSPTRFLLCFGGQSLGAGDGAGPTATYIPNAPHGSSNYDLKVALAPFGLAEFNKPGDGSPVKSEITVVSGLRVPATGGGAAPPPAGWNGLFHTNAHVPLLSGMRTSNNAMKGPTADQVAAEALGCSAFGYRVQPRSYRDPDGTHKSRISYRRLANGSITPVDPIANLQVAYDKLFSLPGLGSASPEELARLKRRRSVLDLVLPRANQLLGQVGAADRERLERHFEEIRNLERALAEQTTGAGAACKKLPTPREPAIGAVYSEEEARARLYCDLVHMGFACNATRVSTLMFTFLQCFMSASPLIGVNTDVHELSHNPSNDINVAKMIAWHLKHFAYLVAKLRDTPDVGGKSMLDNMAVVFLHEGGFGYSPENGGTREPHSTEGMTALVAGRAGGLRPGRHVVAGGKHPVNVLLSAMNAVGVNVNQLGEVSGVIPELF
ncbi:MAG: DUF1552 domain-containing protein [Myxococcaceae bacterium]|nr:DUF1552 domain-containing protein [Myxococcaceae bacterium]